MANLTLNTAGETIEIDGLGGNCPVEEKDFPDYTLNVGSLSPARREAFYAATTDRLPVMRVLLNGGSFALESTDLGRNFPTPDAEQSLREIYARSPGLKTVVSPHSAPSATIPLGAQTVTGLAPGTTSTQVKTQQTFDNTIANWQLWTDSLTAEMNHLKELGASLTWFTTPNEVDANLGSGRTDHQNHWFVHLDQARLQGFVRRVWLGEGLEGGRGIRDRFPELEGIILDSTAGYDARTAIDADPIAKAAVSGYGAHQYGDADGLRALVQADYPLFVTECGMFNATGPEALTDVQTVQDFYGRIHAAFVNARCPFVLVWALSRDIAGMDARGYAAKGLINQLTDQGRFETTPYYQAALAFWEAIGREGAEVYVTPNAVATAQSDPAANVHVSHFRRPDDTHAVLVANQSGTPRTDTLTPGVAIGGLTRRRFHQVRAHRTHDAVEQAVAIDSTLATIPLGEQPAFSVDLYEFTEAA